MALRNSPVVLREIIYTEVHGVGTESHRETKVLIFCKWIRLEPDPCGKEVCLQMVARIAVIYVVALIGMLFCYFATSTLPPANYTGSRLL